MELQLCLSMSTFSLAYHQFIFYLWISENEKRISIKEVTSVLLSTLAVPIQRGYGLCSKGERKKRSKILNDDKSLENNMTFIRERWSQKKIEKKTTQINSCHISFR